jgi:hypothetical protein
VSAQYRKVNPDRGLHAAILRRTQPPNLRTPDRDALLRDKHACGLTEPQDLATILRRQMRMVYRT